MKFYIGFKRGTFWQGQTKDRPIPKLIIYGPSASVIFLLQGQTPSVKYLNSAATLPPAFGCKRRPNVCRHRFLCHLIFRMGLSEVALEQRHYMNLSEKVKEQEEKVKEEKRIMAELRLRKETQAAMRKERQMRLEEQ